jgi:hypothetical protein
LSRNRRIKHAMEGKTEGRVEVKEEEEDDASGYWNIVREI